MSIDFIKNHPCLESGLIVGTGLTIKAKRWARPSQAAINRLSEKRMLKVMYETSSIKKEDYTRYLQEYRLHRRLLSYVKQSPCVQKHFKFPIK